MGDMGATERRGCAQVLTNNAGAKDTGGLLHHLAHAIGIQSSNVFYNTQGGNYLTVALLAKEGLVLPLPAQARRTPEQKAQAGTQADTK